jgi:hypothetical protein
MGGHLRIISFSLWGDNPRYTVGAIRNARLAPGVYSGWKCRFYCASSVPRETVAQLESMAHVEVVQREEGGDWTALFWRFDAASDPDVSVMLSRDADSRLNTRERWAVEEWLASDRDFHVMRDHPEHTAPILGGMWGVRNGLLSNMRELIQSYPKENVWQIDQRFLAEVITPVVKDRWLEHDEYYAKKPFPARRDGRSFVGEPFDARDRSLAESLWRRRVKRLWRWRLALR